MTRLFPSFCSEAVREARLQAVVAPLVGQVADIGADIGDAERSAGEDIRQRTRLEPERVAHDREAFDGESIAGRKVVPAPRLHVAEPSR